MTFQLAFNIFLVLFMSFLGKVWTMKNAFNVCFKIVLFISAFSAWFLAAKELGYLSNI